MDGAPGTRHPEFGSCWIRSEQVGNVVEGDAGGCGFLCREHGGGGKRAEAVFVIELVHGFEQAGAALLAIERVEEIERVQVVRNQAVELHADEVGLVVFSAGGAAGPQSAEGCDEGGIVLAFAEADFAVPATGGHAETADRGFFSARNGEANGEAYAWRPKIGCTEAHGCFVQELMRDGPGFLCRTHFRGQHMRVADGLEMVVFGHVKVLALQPMPETLAPHGAPKFAGLLA